MSLLLAKRAHPRGRGGHGGVRGGGGAGDDGGSRRRRCGCVRAGVKVLLLLLLALGVVLLGERIPLQGVDLRVPGHIKQMVLYFLSVELYV